MCQLHFEIYAPTSGGPWPLIVLEPGGNLPPGAPGDYLDQMATALAGQGAVVMAGQWRQSVQWAGPSPDSFADIACARPRPSRARGSFHADARAFEAALVAGGYHSRLIEIPSADHFGTTVAKESIEAILDLASAQ
jgi:hypothetical protein